MSSLLESGPSYIDPKVLYSKNGAHICSGISATREFLAKKDHGLEMKKVHVGRRVFVRGADLIDFIEKLAEAEAK